uniref:Reverse transcriptase/retrotransposon-derived protein RNase H-like domain-containing protein n=1 Tax=Lepeophtheirus salmonis TaxID=72036 RepID=A0A0K2V6N3_LEPSM
MLKVNGEKNKKKAFDESKRIMSSASVLARFDVKKITKLVTDASKLNGIGFALIQQDKCGECDRKYLIHWGFRTLTPAETRYSAIGLECFAINRSNEKCLHYLKGANFYVEKDHNFKVMWISGKMNILADVLSRFPVSNTDRPEKKIYNFYLIKSNPKLKEL